MAACGDGVREGMETCDHGVANGSDGCCSATCGLIDDDRDAVCDAHDPCSGLVVVPVEVSRLRIRRLGGAIGDERFRFSGRITVAPSPAIDPATNGLHLVLTDHFLRGVILDASVPGGPGWTRTVDGATWRYRRPSGSSGNVTRAEVRVATADPSTLGVVVQGQGAGSDVVPFTPYVLVALAIDAGTAMPGQCGEAILTPSRCRFAIGGRLSCGPMPPVRPCAGDPSALTACDARNCASVQERFFVDNGTYYTGDCDAVPGFIASPDVYSVTAGNSVDFAVAATHVPTETVCQWVSAPAPGEPNLHCLQ
jgi:hypothetical protein